MSRFFQAATIGHRVALSIQMDFKIALFLFGIAASIPSHAGLYKCSGAGGKVVYQDSPCAGGTGKLLDIPEPAHNPRSQYQAELEAQRDIAAARRLDQERELRRAQADLDQQRKDRDRRLQDRHCGNLEERASRAETLANRMPSSYPYREYERANAQALRDRHWSECYTKQ